jgi:PAS domain S-box-containing protein
VEENMDKEQQGGPQSLQQTDHRIPGAYQTVSKAWAKEWLTPKGILAISITGIALAHLITMLFSDYTRQWSHWLNFFFSTFIMTVSVFPLLYFLLFKPLLLKIQQQSRVETITASRLHLMEYATSHTLDELLQFILDELESMTASSIGFLHYLEDDQKTLWLKAWSTNTLQFMCQAQGKDSHYDVEQDGVWADAVRYRQPVLHNDYAALQHRKGTPEGHAQITREMVIPTLRGNMVVAIVGLGNKAQDYTSSDVELVTTLTDFAWDIVVRKQAEEALRQSEAKFRSLIDWTYDWEKWLDPDGNLVYCSPSCERITGHSPEEFIANPDLLKTIVHPDERQFYIEHHQTAHNAQGEPTSLEYRIISRDGGEHWIEHACKPLYGTDDQYLGHRVSNRDITVRKQNEKKIIEHNKKEMLLTQTLQTIQIDIARDLHDTLGQNISYLRMALESLSESDLGDPVAIKGQLQYMNQAANESYELIRTMLAVLKTGTSSDPLSLFSRYVEQVAERSGFKCDISSQGEPKELTPQQIHQLFYIFREALNNIEKYAKAEQVRVEFCWEEHTLTLAITDDGCGFDPDAVQTSHHFGLQFIRQRTELLNGSISIQSAIGQGTTIAVTVPYAYELSTSHQ